LHLHKKQISHTDGNVVVVVNHNKVTELQVTGSRGSLAGNSLHSTTITEESVGVVGADIETGLVENGSSVCLSNSETDSIGETLTKGTGGNLDTGGVVGLRVTRCDGVDGLWDLLNLCAFSHT